MRTHWMEFELTRADLIALNERLADLDVEPRSLEEFRPLSSLTGLMIERLQNLQNKDDQ